MARRLRGERQHLSKLTPTMVRDCRARLRSEAATVEQIAHEYGVHESTIRNVITGKTWQHVA